MVPIFRSRAFRLISRGESFPTCSINGAVDGNCLLHKRNRLHLRAGAPRSLSSFQLPELNREHILYVQDYLGNVKTLTGNIKAHTLATMGQYCALLVSRDLAGNAYFRSPHCLGCPICLLFAKI